MNIVLTIVGVLVMIAGLIALMDAKSTLEVYQATASLLMGLLVIGVGQMLDQLIKIRKKIAPNYSEILREQRQNQRAA